MPPEKSQMDTIRIYLRSIFSEDKVNELMEKVNLLTPEKAEEIIMAFEQRRRLDAKDIQKLLR
ncbi:MAG: hypothetical protein J7K68_03280 [Candidatus Diapherotrites archaeon]|nr:hypothetical protein [Candidatus Diapherotrites archaeon]